MGTIKTALAGLALIVQAACSDLHLGHSPRNTMSEPAKGCLVGTPEQIKSYSNKHPNLTYREIFNGLGEKAGEVLAGRVYGQNFVVVTTDPRFCSEFPQNGPSLPEGYTAR
ncbi:hypothetical protein HY638_01470 [Candidatus Woesearchaeota archaeon]|nr:hypothetical protein [Candidatus Woesearchaeota archaeon]